jgi:HEAT repeat protein
MGFFDWFFGSSAKKQELSSTPRVGSSKRERRTTGFRDEDRQAIEQIKNVEPLIKVLRTDQDWLARKHAAEALGKLGGPRAVELLIEVLHTDKHKYVRAHAVEALAKLMGLGALELLIDVLRADNEDEDVRKHAAEALGKLGGPRAVEPLIEVLSTHEDRFARMYAAEALGKLGDVRATQVLTKAVQKYDLGVGISAANAIRQFAERGDRGAVDALVQMLEMHNRLREIAAQSLQNLKWTPTSPRQHALFLIGLGRYKDAAKEGGVTVLMDAAKDLPTKQVQPVIDVLVSVGGLKALIAALKHDNLAAAATSVLCRLPSAEAFEPLVHILKNASNKYHRANAATALGQIGGPGATEALAAAMNDAEPYVIHAVALALAKIGSDVALAAVLHYAKSVANPSDHILRSIARFEMEPAMDFLIERGERCVGLWEALKSPKHKLLLLRSRDRCRRVAQLIAKSIAEVPYSREETYEFLTTIMQEQGATVDAETLNTIVGLQPPKAGRADEGYEKIQDAADRARNEAYRCLLKAAITELQRRKHQ